MTRAIHSVPADSSIWTEGQGLCREANRMTFLTLGIPPRYTRSH
jgi:hypothetical protein